MITLLVDLCCKKNSSLKYLAGTLVGEAAEQFMAEISNSEGTHHDCHRRFKEGMVSPFLQDVDLHKAEALPNRGPGHHETLMTGQNVLEHLSPVFQSTSESFWRVAFHTMLMQSSQPVF